MQNCWFCESRGPSYWYYFQVTSLLKVILPGILGQRLSKLFCRRCPLLRPSAGLQNANFRIIYRCYPSHAAIGFLQKFRAANLRFLNKISLVQTFLLLTSSSWSIVSPKGRRNRNCSGILFSPAGRNLPLRFGILWDGNDICCRSLFQVYLPYLCWKPRQNDHQTIWILLRTTAIPRNTVTVASFPSYCPALVFWFSARLVFT